MTLHIATDKPTYRVGDNLYARAFVLDAFGKQPAQSFVDATAEVVGPKVRSSAFRA